MPVPGYRTDSFFGDSEGGRSHVLATVCLKQARLNEDLNFISGQSQHIHRPNTGKFRVTSSVWCSDRWPPRHPVVAKCRLSSWSTSGDHCSPLLRGSPTIPDSCEPIPFISQNFQDSQCVERPTPLFFCVPSGCILLQQSHQLQKNLRCRPARIQSPIVLLFCVPTGTILF